MTLLMLEDGTFVIFQTKTPIFACKYINTMIKFLASKTKLDFRAVFKVVLEDMAINNHNSAEFGIFGEYLYTTNRSLKEFV